MSTVMSRGVVQVANPGSLRFTCPARSIAPWLRSQRMAAPTRLTQAHQLALSAIPFVLPAIELEHTSAGRDQK